MLTDGVRMSSRARAKPIKLDKEPPKSSWLESQVEKATATPPKAKKTDDLKVPPRTPKREKPKGKPSIHDFAPPKTPKTPASNNKEKQRVQTPELKPKTKPEEKPPKKKPSIDDFAQGKIGAGGV